MALERFGVSMDAALLAEFDRLLERQGYPNRSEAIRDLVRRQLASEACSDNDEPSVGSVTIFYDHHQRELSERLVRAQHNTEAEIVCTTHVHLDHRNCLEVIVMRGAAGLVRDVGARLAGMRGVKHGDLSLVAGLDRLA